MRLLFLTHRPGAPSVRWRVEQWLPHLRAQGWDCHAEPLARGLLARRRQFRRAAEFDVVVLQKRIPGPPALRTLRRATRRLVFEFDDAIPLARTSDGATPSPMRARRFARVLKACDAAITSNEYLADLARPHLGDRPITILPNAIDPDAWSPRTDWSCARTLGWNGSGGNLHHLEAILPELHGLPARLRLVTDAPGLPAGVERIPFDPQSEADQVRRFDIALAPLPDDPWTRGKCPVKTLTYMAAAVPVVASDVPPHRIYVRDGENGLLVAPGEWRAVLSRLLADAALRERLGRAARRDVETRFHVRHVAQRLADFLRQLIAPPLRPAGGA